MSAEEGNGSKRKAGGDWVWDEETCTEVKRRVTEQYGRNWAPDRHTRIDTLRFTKFAHGPVSEERVKILPSVETLAIKDPVEFQAKLRAIMAHGVETQLAKAGEGAIGQVIICNRNLHGGAMSTKFQSIADMQYSDIEKLFFEARNSEELKRGEEGGEGILLEDTEFHFTRVESQKFGVNEITNRFSRRHDVSARDWAHQKASIVNPFDKRTSQRLNKPWEKNWCVLIAVVLGKHRADNEGRESTFYQSFHQNIALLRRKIAELIAGAGIKREGPHSIDTDLKSISNFLGEGYQINCYFDGGKPKHSFGPNAGKQINLFFEPKERHCNLISSIIGFLVPRVPLPQCFCVECKSCYSGQYNHKCKSSECPLCSLLGCKNRSQRKLWQNAITCPQCHRHMWTPSCFASHRLNPHSCSSVHKCLQCGEFFDPKKGHKNCGLSRCSLCKAVKSFDHVCFMQPDKVYSGRKKDRMRFYYDIESIIDPETNVHHPNLLIVVAAPRESGDEPLEPFRTYWGRDCVDKFVEDLLRKDSPFAESYMVAHNSSNYDGGYVHGALLRAKHPPSVLMRGQSYLHLHLRTNDIVFRDSYLFLPGVSLAKLAKMYELEQGKGLFPYYLNQDEFLEQGAYCEDGHRFPRQRWFGPQQMRAAERAAFERWWAAEDARFAADPSLTYNVRQELYKYCLLDCRILARGFERFLFDARAKNPDFDPLESVTTPSYCNRLYRNIHMPPSSIALLPGEGFSPNGAGTSAIELAWVAWMGKKLNLVSLRTNRNFRPIRISGHKVDGFGVDASGNRFIFELLGCFWHSCDAVGCPYASTPPQSAEKAEERLSRRTEASRRLATLQRAATHPHSPYAPATLVAVWEHEVRDQMKADPHMAAFIRDFKQRLQLSAPLSLRDGFHGGRTNCAMHYFKADEKLVGLYGDICSLYPAINACSEEGELYPTGYPEIYISTQVDELIERVGVEGLFGVVKCELYPPRRLKFPVIPVSSGGKLTFPLCARCAETQSQESCRCPEEQRKLIVTVYTPEFHAAREVGYRVGRVFEVWHFPPAQRSSELLRGYIADFYQEKEFASGFPADVVSEEEKQAYASECSKALGIPLDWRKFKKNSGKRGLFKNFINNFWGFFGKRSNLTTHQFTDNFQDFVKVQSDPSREVKEVRVVGSGEYIQLGHAAAGPEEAGPKSSLLIAAFTTSMARLRLWRLLHAYQDHILYFDTDGIIFTSPRGQPPVIDMAGGFGKVKNELEAMFPGRGAYICGYTSLGPKTYSVDICDRDGNFLGSEIRMKGISKTSEVDETVTHDCMADIARSALNNLPREPVRVPQMQFKKNVKDQNVMMKHMMKSINFSSSKRRFVKDSQNGDTLPFGFVDVE